MADQPAQLQRGALGLTDVVFQGITHLAPALSVVFIMPVIAKHAGAAMPLSLALSVIVCFFIANTVAQFSRYVPSSGGYYTFVSRGLGPRWGFLTTWSYLIYDIAGPAGAIGFFGYETARQFPLANGQLIPWWLFSLAAILIVWVFTYIGIRISTHLTAVLGGIEMLIFLALGITFLIFPNPESSATAPLNPSLAPNGWGGVLGGMVFSILALSGFEAPAPLAQETRRPTSFIYLAIFTSLLIVGLFYVFMAYASAIGWGTARMPEFAMDDQRPYNVLAKTLWGQGRWLVFFALFNSVLAVGISCTNAASRVMYTMALTGALPAALKKIHPIHKTPHIAVHTLQLIQIASFLLVGFCFGEQKIFDCLGTIVALAVIVLYGLANCALTLFIWREHPTDFHLWRHGILPTAGTLFLLPATVATFLSISNYPESLMPYLFLILMLMGFAVMKGLELWHPEALAPHSSVTLPADPFPPAPKEGDDNG
jgi:amino acid transporter